MLKLSQLQQAMRLGYERTNLIGMLDDIDWLEAVSDDRAALPPSARDDDEDGDGEGFEVSLRVNGWEVEIPRDKVEALMLEAKSAAERRIAEIEAQLAMWGIEIDTEDAEEAAEALAA